MSKMDNRIKESVETYLLAHYPDEKVMAYVQAIDMSKTIATGALLGPIGAASATQSYYIGLTERRLFFIALSKWTNKPTDKTFETLLGRIHHLAYKKHLITGELRIHFGENKKMTLTVPYPQRQNGEQFARAFASLPQSTITDMENIISRQLETGQKQINRDQWEWAAIAILVAALAWLVWSLITLL